MPRDCYASLVIQKAVETYGQKVEKDCKTPFWMRIGLHSGAVIVGSVGKDLKMDYAAVGDTVNLASGMRSAFGQISQSSGPWAVSARPWLPLATLLLQMDRPAKCVSDTRSCAVCHSGLGPFPHLG